MKKKRYNLVLSEQLYDQVKEVAEKHNYTFLAMINKFIKIGLMAERSDAIILRKDGEEKEIIII